MAEILATHPTPESFPAFGKRKIHWPSFLATALTGLATVTILAMLGWIFFYIFINGASVISWSFITSSGEGDMFNQETTGVLPMIVGTFARVLLMTLMVMPIGVITAIYLSEYAPPHSWVTRVTRAAINNLAGVPSIVFGLFALGFFINFVGKHMDEILRHPEAVWGKPVL